MPLLDFLNHLDEHLLALVQSYGFAAYAVLFAIIFSETGLVIAPFLPGDILLFVAGTVALGTSLSASSFNLPLLWIVLSLAAFLGNQVNFAIGRWLGPKVFHWERSALFNPRHLREAHEFYERHGGKTLVLARFLPIIRTYAPFVAGIGDMSHRRFAFFNGIGAIFWVGSLLLTGHFFGNVPFVKTHLTGIILGIVAVSVFPALVAALQSQRRKTAQRTSN